VIIWFQCKNSIRHLDGFGFFNAFVFVDVGYALVRRDPIRSDLNRHPIVH